MRKFLGPSNSIGSMVALELIYHYEFKIILLKSIVKYLFPRKCHSPPLGAADVTAIIATTESTTILRRDIVKVFSIRS